MCLLSRPRHDGLCVEEYHTIYISVYNKMLEAEPLPLEPNIEEFPPLPALPESINQLLVFWAHIAPLHKIEDTRGDRRHIEHQGDRDCEVVLVEARVSGVSDQEEQIPLKCYYGMIVERYAGFVRKVGVTRGICIEDWTTAEPQLELILLI
jgi:hypothetical protein